MKKIKGFTTLYNGAGRMNKYEWDSLSDLLKTVREMFEGGYLVMDPNGEDKYKNWYREHIYTDSANTVYFEAQPSPRDQEESEERGELLGESIEVPLSELLGPASEIEEVQKAFLKHVRAKLR